MKVVRSSYLTGSLIGLSCFAFGLFAKYAIDNSAVHPTGTPTSYVTDSLERSIEGPVEEIDNIGCMGDGEDDPRFGPIEISKNRRLTTIFGSLYVRDLDGRIIWKKLNLAPLTDAPKMIGPDLVVIGQDLTLIGLDPETGQSRWQYLLNGRGLLKDLVKYDEGRFLILIDMSLYDERLVSCGERHDLNFATCQRSNEDKVLLFYRDEVKDSWEIPANSKLQVKNEKIYVISKSRRTTLKSTPQ